MKRMLAALLAVLMLAMPLSGLAEMNVVTAYTTESDNYYDKAINAGRRVTFTMSMSDVAADFTGEPAVDQVIYDILDALVITGYMQGDEGYYAIGMKQESGAVADLLTMGVAVAGEDAYILSNLIGGTIVVSADEVVPVLERVIDLLVQMGMIPETEAESIKAQMPEMWAMMQEEFAGAFASQSALDQLDPATFNYDALLAIVETVSGKVITGEPAVLPRNCDTAVSMITVTLTPAEMNGLLISVLQFIKDNPDLANAIAAEIDFENTIAPEFSSVSGEPVDFMGFIDQLIAKLGEKMIYAGDVVYRIWMGEDGMPVAMDCVAPILSEDETVEFHFDYTRLTMNENVVHSGVLAFPGGDVTVNVIDRGETITIGLAVAENGETRIDAKLDYTDRSADNLIACDVALDLTVTEADVSMTYYAGDVSHTQTQEDTTINVQIALTSDTVLDGVDFTEDQVLKITVNGKEYMTINLHCQTEDAGDSIMTGNVVRPAELNDNDFANWFVNAYSAVFSWPQNLIFAMPASFMNLINTGY